MLLRGADQWTRAASTGTWGPIAGVHKGFELSGRNPAYTAQEVGRITHRTLVMAADDDSVTLQHMLEL